MATARIMAAWLGETVEGTVVGISSFGAFVRIDRPFVEGLLHVSDVAGDYLEFDRRRHRLLLHLILKLLKDSRFLLRLKLDH